jgi:ribosomal 50S subunit-recycling heat shock protein
VIVKASGLRYNPFVRLDLFLKASRLVKRRAVAQEMCDAGRVLVNGTMAKPAKEVKPGDGLRLSYLSRFIEVEVLAIPIASKNIKEQPEELYRVTREQQLSRENNA